MPLLIKTADFFENITKIFNRIVEPSDFTLLFFKNQPVKKSQHPSTGGIVLGFVLSSNRNLYIIKSYDFYKVKGFLIYEIW